MRKMLIVPFLLHLIGCLGMPAQVKPVSNFELERYLGTWYEIARLDHSFERGLSQVTAEYSQIGDGGVRVINKGYSETQQKWNQAEGKAYFVESTNQGYLKVSFFGPFYGSYVIFELGDNYEYAFVSGSNTSYLWLLSRTPTVSEKLRNHFIDKAQSLGFDTNKLIFVPQKH